MKRKELNKNAYALEIIPDSAYALYFKGDLVAVSNLSGDIAIDEEIKEQTLETIDQFVELLNNDNPLVFEMPKERLKTVTSSIAEGPIFYDDWRA